LVNDLWRFDTIEAKWYTLIANYPSNIKLPTGRSYFEANLLSNETFIIFGGLTNITNYNDLWIFNPCFCYNGYCVNNIYSCFACSEGYYGPYCNNSCACVNKNCSEGVNGTGECICDPSNITCQECNCINGDCDLNGSCHCYPNYIGPNCNQICVDNQCLISCVCNDPILCHQGGIICINNITIYNLNISINSSIQFEGIILIENTNLDLSSNLFSELNITLSNSNILFNLSSIISNSCINISHTNLTIDLSHIPPHEEKLLLLNSTIGCLIGDSYTIYYLNQPSCATLNSVKTSYSLIIILQFGCQSLANPIEIWKIALIVVGSIVGLAVIAIMIILITTTIRKKILHKKKI